MKWGFLVVISGFIIHLNLIGYLYSYNLLHIQLKENFNSTATEAALPGSVSIAFYAISSMLTTWTFQRIGDRPAGLIGVFFCCISLLLSSFVHRLWILCLTYGLMFGMGCNVIHLVTVDMVVVYFKGSSTRYLAIILTASSVGVLLSPALEWLYVTYNWRVSLRILSVMFALICMPCIMAFKDNRPHRFSPTRLSEEKCEQIPSSLSLIQKYADMIRRPAFFSMMCAYAMAGIATTFSFISIGSFLTNSGMDGTEISFILSLMGAGDLCIRVIMSLVSDRLPLSVTSQYAVAHVMAASSTMFLPYIVNETMILIILIAFSISRGIIFVLIASAPIEIAPVYSSVESVGLVYLIFGICALSTPYMTDNLYDVTGSYDSAFYICCSLYACGAIFLFISVYLKRKNCRDADTEQKSNLKYDIIPSVKEPVSRVTVV